MSGQTTDQLSFFLQYLADKDMLSDEAKEQVKENDQKVVNEYLRTNPQVVRDIGA